MAVALIVLLAAVLMIAIEVQLPGRQWPRVAGWWSRAAFLNALQVGCVWLGGIAWSPWLQRHRLWSGDGLGQFWGPLVGYLAITFVYYWWHRWRHESDLLWRWVHQVHHSPQRIEVITSFYKHPIELVSNGLLSSAILYIGVGLGPSAAASAVLLTGLAELFYHWNIRTPYWLGFIVQRPESHCVHHQEGSHSYNYADLPIWDMLFGTFRNPAEWDARCGLGASNENRLEDMLVGVDVLEKRSSRGRRELRLAWVLLALGLLQILGDLSGASTLKAMAASTAASPAPRVFCAHRGYETISTRIRLEVEENDRWRSVDYPIAGGKRLKGPYNRRNVYGAAVAYAPVLPLATREASWRYALCGRAPLLNELGLSDLKGKRKRLVYEMRDGRREIEEVPCR